MTHVVAIIQARMSSSRLPGKVLLDIYGQPLLERVINQVRQSAAVDTLVVATSLADEDRVIEMLCQRMNIACFRGSLTDVRSRYVAVAQDTNASVIVRATADNPLTEPRFIDTLVAAIRQKREIQYCVMDQRQVPYGSNVEVFTAAALYHSVELDQSAYAQEHVTPGIRAHYAIHEVAPGADFAINDLRVTVDTLEDYICVNEVFARYDGTHNILCQLIADTKHERSSYDTLQP